jgi:protein TonB
VAPVDGYDAGPPVFQSDPGSSDEFDPNANFVYTAPSTADENELRTNYIKGNYSYIQNLIRRKLIYPQQAKRMGIKGTVGILFTINADGTVSDVTVDKSSGHDILDQAAMDAILKASPFPKPPLMAQIAIPIDFKLR